MRVTAHPVVGSVLAVSPPPMSEDGYAGDEFTVLVGWTEPGGAARTAWHLTYGTAPRVGDVWSVWVNPAGAPVPPPMTGRDTSREGAVAALGVLVATCTALASALALVAGCSTVAGCGTGTRTGRRSDVIPAAPPTDPHAGEGVVTRRG